MTTQTEPSTDRRSLIPWRKRAEFRPGKTRRQRQTQYRNQINALLIVLLVAIVGGGVYTLINYREAGSTKTVSCDAFPEYCLPLAGGAGGEDYANLEAPGSRELDAESEGVAGVVRGINPIHGFAELGDPAAPIHFVTVSDFACSHCQDFHMGDLKRFIKDYVLSGQATFGFVMGSGTGGAYSQLANQAALCAGEQGAFWEISSEFFRQANAGSVTQKFTIDGFRNTAEEMGLDGEQLINCIASGKYQNLINSYLTFGIDNGVTGTPTVLVSYGGSDSWSKVNRTYDSLKALTEAANAAE
ncbi:MAG: thioredoxin domain-containing protein [Anaerolineae bacterium]|nr:thioredoxin domain-containing protein [Anaerolineae bacterium]